MKGRHNDFQGGFILELGVRVHRNSAPVVAHGDTVVGAQLQLDPRGVPGHGLVHGVVQQLGNQVMHCPLVAAADIHTGATAHRFEALEDLDVFGGVVLCTACDALEEVRHRARALPYGV